MISSGNMGSLLCMRHSRPRFVPLAAMTFFLALSVPTVGRSDDAATDHVVVPRAILALYDSRVETSLADSRIHRLAEMPLNHLGYRLDFWDLANGAPPVPAPQTHIAVITWFEEPIADPTGVFSALLAASDAGLRIIMLGDPGDDGSRTSARYLRQLFGRLGLTYDGSGTEVTMHTSIALEDRDIMGFERRVTAPLPPFEHIVERTPDVRVHLRLAYPNGSAVAVATGLGGGYAASGYEVFYDPARDRTKWLIDPFRFFWKALGEPTDPVPDTTTSNGRRIYFSHIDGDGWNNLSEVDRHKGELTAAVVLDHLIRPFPDLPVSVGVIAGDVDPALGATSRSAEIARQLFALPQVEVASHTYTHPFDWSVFAQDYRAQELAVIGDLENNTMASRITSILGRLAGRPDDTTDRYAGAFVEGLPRAYPKDAFDLDKEIAGALDVATGLAPPGKRARLYQWSGETNPFEAALSATRETGVDNINGGDSRYDWEWPSVAYLAPLARQVGSELQIYAGSSNENTYTNNWHGPYFGLRYLLRTLDATERPRRLLPKNLYYHMFSGEKLASLSAVRSLLEKFRGERIMPVEASRYARIVKGFYDAKIVRVGTDRWQVQDRGQLDTMRFDHAGGRQVDLEASVGVTGYTMLNGSIYVSLDPAYPTPIVALGRRGSDAATPPLRLVESRWALSDFRREECGFTANVTGFGNGDLRFADVRPGRYRIDFDDRAQPIVPSKATVGADGELRLHLEASAIAPRRLRATCSDTP